MCAMHVKMIKESENISNEDETPVFVHSLVRSHNKGKLLDKMKGCSTLHDALSIASVEHGDLNFLGVINNQEKIEYVTYREGWNYAKSIAQFILMHADLSEDKLPIVGICSENRPEWVITEHATYFYSGINCPIYASFGWSATKHIIKETGMNIIFISRKNAEKIAASLEKEEQDIVLPKIFVLMDSDISETAFSVLGKFEVKMYYFWDIVKRCKKASESGKSAPEEMPLSSKFVKAPALKNEVVQKFVPPTQTTIATICYTSGTTGAPKGAMLMHKNFISVVASFILLSEKGVFFDIKPGNRYLSFLPLAHVFERIVESALLISKCEIVYYRGNPKQLQNDFRISRPHYFVGVPRVFNSVKGAIEGKVREKSKLAQWIFAFALSVCIMCKNRVVRGIFGKTVFRQIRETFGGNVISMLSGSAPLSPSTAVFFEAIFNCPFFEGYGQTETAAGNITTDVFTLEKGVIGVPFPCNKVKLASCPEVNALAKDMRGEILMQGHSVFYGYYKQEALTKECFYRPDGESIYNEDGEKWIRTGDVGEVTKEGNLRIIGRCKEIFKLSQGEYIIPEKIENLILSKKIEGLEDITIVGDSSRDYVIGICTVSNQEKCKDIESEAACVGNKLVTAGELIKIELPRRLIFTEDAFTIDNGLLTPSGKKIRKKIVALYSKKIQSIYKKG
ncbi:long-chain acyl-CoA synthetase [Nematocida major]|uniref:long-chain acyl-CoA synthetase n=1 Tax=Nematocida major TaxID=1912982 RepID=UPI002007DCA7|nr:long-chain acyl-CoA synthetase [Nematocida major]KAH9386867.1 long-chain acyl-CoA synthetase [Nematocida major]